MNYHIIPIKRPCPNKRPPICSCRSTNYAHKPLKTRPSGTNIWSVSMRFDIYGDLSIDHMILQ